jgi:hypothetical protein
MGAERRKAEAKHKQTQAAQDTPTRDRLQTHPLRSAKAIVQQATADNLPSPSPSARRNRSHAHANPTASDRVTCPSEWRDLSAVEGPSRGGLGASEQLSDRRRHLEVQDATFTDMVPLQSASSFSWAGGHAENGGKGELGRRDRVLYEQRRMTDRSTLC